MTGARLQRVAVDLDVEVADEVVPLTVVLRPVSLVATERHFKGTPPPIEGTLYAAWYQLTTGPGRDARFDGVTFGEFLERVAAVAERSADPSPATPAELSPPSPS